MILFETRKRCRAELPAIPPPAGAPSHPASRPQHQHPTSLSRPSWALRPFHIANTSKLRDTSPTRFSILLLKPSVHLVFALPSDYASVPDTTSFKSPSGLYRSTPKQRASIKPKSLRDSTNSQNGDATRILQRRLLESDPCISIDSKS